MRSSTNVLYFITIFDVFYCLSLIISCLDCCSTQKNMKIFQFEKVIVFIILKIQFIGCGKCPENEVIYPCECREDIIFCGGESFYNLTSIFESINSNLNDNEKHFKALYLDNNAITELADNTFSDIVFEEIHIQKAGKLTKISSKAFSKNIINSKYLELNDLPLQINGERDNIIDIINSMESVEKVELIKVNFTELPSNAFKPTSKNLRQISIRQNFMKTLGENAFYEIDNLQYLSLFDNQIDLIPKQAFRFRANSSKELILDISYNKLNLSTISVEAFSDAKRQLYIQIGGNNITFLDQQLFKPILSRGDRFDAFNCPLVCDCRMFWIFQKKVQFVNQIFNGHCEDESSIFDESNYVKLLKIQTNNVRRNGVVCYGNIW